MATKKKAEQEKKAEGGEILQKAAKLVGSTMGAIAKKTGIAHADPKPPEKKIGKLVKKAKSRLPRRQKKQAKKAASIAEHKP